MLAKSCTVAIAQLRELKEYYVMNPLRSEHTSDWQQFPCKDTGLNTHIRLWRGGLETLVFLHGLGVDGSVWQAVVRRYFPTYTCIALDLRGHGLSVHPDKGYGGDDYVQDIVSALVWLRERFGELTIIGHSLGAVIAAGVAATVHSLVQRLILADPPMHGPGDIVPYLEDVLCAQARGKTALERVVGRYQPKLGNLLQQVQVQMWQQTAPAVLETILNNPDTVFKLEQWLPRIVEPVLFLAADPRQDARLTPPLGRHAVAITPAGQLRTLEGADHVLHASAPQAFAEAVLDFIQHTS